MEAYDQDQISCDAASVQKSKLYEGKIDGKMK